MGAVSIRRVSKRFKKDDGSEFTALHDISFEIADDEFVSFVGPSGCGKTTLFRIVAGLDHATEGTVFVDNTEIVKPSPLVGMVFQEYSLFPWLNVLDNIAFGPKMQGISKEVRYQDAQKYVELVGLTGFERSYPYELSGGMRQRVAIARALVNNPDLLIMDEPFGALDAQTRNMMQRELLDIWEKQKKTILFVTHSVDEAVYLSDRIVVLSRGPGRISEVVPVALTRPRERTEPEFASLRKQVLDMIENAI
ncbi:MAG: ABC transporter ATP-binding protein [Methanomicrobiales archaeon]|jgi:NitT/TauT family transport system ATP-binding protein|nr:ABC transporter ATP-binding protein [Methanomicrobiales archaeon]